ncbi:hypothetical protein CRM22_009934 [Opisthorchis felineus]|uniref:Uncharacterized protein n=1 Tax=Opisthorchis felineus TaxID=147828 RepID=A0A4S2LAN0_OPIFE|nr:hypothetical protein CRM22_009934 [Opisthorchis felineus]
MGSSIVGLLLQTLQILPTLQLQNQPSTNPNKPVIRTNPTDQFSVDGVLEFSCLAEGNPKPFVQWHNATNGQLITDRIPSTDSLSGIHVNPYHGRLMVSNPTRGQLYSFYCNATNEYGWSQSSPPVFGALAYLDDRFIQQPNNETAQVGQNVSLHCLAPEGLPKPTIRWLKDDVHVAEQSTGHMPTVRVNESTSSPLSKLLVLDNGTLWINSVTFEETGNYRCMATNLIGSRSSRPAFLSVMSTTTFFETPKHLRVRLGEDAKFFCEADDPKTVSWRRGKQDAPLDFSRTVITRSYIWIKSVKPSDSGIYICSVPGSAEHNATLVVDTPPRFLRPPKNIRANVGETIQFVCLSTGHPQPSVYWELPDMTPVFPSDPTTEGRSSRFFVHTDGRLEVRHIKSGDAGRYQCTAHSSIDTIHASASLIVNEVTSEPPQLANSETSTRSLRLEPRLSNTAPIIGLPPANQTVSVGDKVTFVCELMDSSADQTSCSDVKVTWMRRIHSTKESRLLPTYSSNDTRYRILHPALRILDVRLSDSGVYICSASCNVEWFDGIERRQIHVESSWSATLYVTWKKDTPKLASILQPPKNLRLVNMTATSVTISWDPPSLAAVRKHKFSEDVANPVINSVAYWVEYYRSDRPADGWLVVERDWPTNNVQLRGLEQRIEYYFLVRSRWMYGRIGWASRPLGPVTTLGSFVTESQDTGKGGQVQMYHHTPPSIEVYDVQMRIFSKSTAKVSWRLSPVSFLVNVIKLFKLSYTITPLGNCVGIFNKKSRNRAYLSGVLSSRDYCSFARDSTKEILLQSQLTLMEELRKSTQQNASTFSVLVPWLKSGHPEDLDPPENPPERLVGWLHNLNPFTCYSIIIHPIPTDPSLSSIFRQTLSEPHFLLTPEGVPTAAPNNISVHWVDDRHVKLSWKSPIVTHWNGPLSGYLIYIFEENSRERKTINVTYLLSETLLELHHMSDIYLFQLACMTCAGVGIPSEPIRLLPRQSKDLSIYATETEPKNVELLNKPWFVGTLIGSVIAWCVLITLASSCCFRLHHRRRKPHKRIGLQIAAALSDQEGNHDALLYMKDKFHLSNVTQMPANGMLLNVDGVSGHTSPCDRSGSHTEYLLPSSQEKQKRIPDAQRDGSNQEARTSSVTSSREHSLVKEPQCTMRPSMSISTDRSIRTMPENNQALRCLASHIEWDTEFCSYPHDMLPPFQMSPQPMYQITKPYPAVDDLALGFNPSSFGDGSAATTESFLSHSSKVLISDSATATPYATTSLISQNKILPPSAYQIQHTYLKCMNTVSQAPETRGTVLNRCQSSSSSAQTSYASSCDNSESLMDSMPTMNELAQTANNKYTKLPRPYDYDTTESNNPQLQTHWSKVTVAQSKQKSKIDKMTESPHVSTVLPPRSIRAKKPKIQANGVPEKLRNSHSSSVTKNKSQPVEPVTENESKGVIGKRYFETGDLPPPPVVGPPSAQAIITDHDPLDKQSCAEIHVRSRNRYSFMETPVPSDTVTIPSGSSVQPLEPRGLPSSSLPVLQYLSKQDEYRYQEYQ